MKVKVQGEKRLDPWVWVWQLGWLGVWVGFGGLNSTLGEFDWGLGELGDRREEAVVGFGGGGDTRKMQKVE